MRKLLKTIRFDASDTNVFTHAALVGEWAVSAAFQFVDCQFEELDGKSRQAFSNGFLGLESFGYATFGVVSKITDAEFERVSEQLAGHIMEHYRAPDMTAALEAARGEIDYVAGLCDAVAENTVFAVRREFSLDGRVKEAFHKVDLESDGALHAKIWTIEEDGNDA